jgi:selenide,water dikinase
MEATEYRLTQYTTGGGCGCKIAPADLEEILGRVAAGSEFSALLVGRDKKDDAAVYALSDEYCVISTTDFFTPIVDNPFEFGRIAAANAISDVYAMGGKPLMALALLAWPLDKLPKELASQVVDGARSICEEAGIPLAGGHSINIPEILFGLAVTGLVGKSQLKTNAGAMPGDSLFLTKKIGVGMLSSALKRGDYSALQLTEVIQQMQTLNRLGESVANIKDVHAMTDVTGFGLAGHLVEMCEASGTSACIELDKLPLLDAALMEPLLESGKLPGNTMRNFNSYGHKCAEMDKRTLGILCDPQTNGGLLIAVAKEGIDEFLQMCRVLDVSVTAIGTVAEQKEHLLYWK